MVVTLQNHSGILNNTTGISAAEPRHTLCKSSNAIRRRHTLFNASERPFWRPHRLGFRSAPCL